MLPFVESPPHDYPVTVNMWLLLSEEIYVHNIYCYTVYQNLSTDRYFNKPLKETMHRWRLPVLNTFNTVFGECHLPSGAPEFTPIFSRDRVTRSLVLCVCFVDRCLSFCTFLCCLFFFDLRILITSLWYLLWFTDSDYPFGIFNLFLYSNVTEKEYAHYKGCKTVFRHYSDSWGDRVVMQYE